MATKVKITKACNAMKKLGYLVKVVRPVLKELLKLYDNNWMLIEDDGYRVLVDAILDSQDQKSNELGHLNAWSKDEAEENEPLFKRSKRSSHTDQSSPSIHASIPHCSKDVENQPHGKRTKDIELEPPHVSKYCHGKRKTRSSPPSLIAVEQAKKTKLISDDESDEPNNLEPVVHLENSGDESNSGHDFSEKGMVTYEKGKHTLFSQDTGYLHDGDVAVEENAFDKHPHEAALDSRMMSHDLSGFVVPPDPPRCVLQGSLYENSPNAIGNCSRIPKVIDLDAEDTRNSSDLEGNHSESMNCKQSEAKKNENDARDPWKLDIASSSTGEVKISLMIESSLRSDFHVPSLEALLKQVEVRCLKLYRIPQTGFSMQRLMKEVCECFLAVGTTSACTEDIRPENARSSLGISEDPDSETDSVEGIDRQLNDCSNSTISNDPIKIHNLFQVSPRIPRFIGSVHLDLSCCKIYLGVHVNGSSAMGRNIVELNSGASSSSGMMIVPKKHCYHYVEDITKGLEPYGISLINEVNGDRGPTFNYISKNVTYQNAYVRFRVASISEENCCSHCFGDCLSLKIPCTCAGETGGEFGYTPGGLLKENFLDYSKSVNHVVQQLNLFYCQDCPLERSNGKNLSGQCKGHIVRKFIKECWYKCGCSMECGNRVVQQGITVKLQVFMTQERKGWGLRTLGEIPKGAFICEYVGEVLTHRELSERNMQDTGDKHTYAVLLDAGWSSGGVLKDEEALFLDASVYGNVARFINHRCFDANLVDIPVQVETPDHHYYHLAFFTTRNVNAMEELTWDYGIDFNDDQSAKAFQCHCGSEYCRDHKSIKRTPS